MTLQAGSFILEHNFPINAITIKFLLPLLLLLPLSTLTGDKDCDQCMLDYQRAAKSGVAVHSITQACDRLCNDDSFLLSWEKAYYECLLGNLPGAENNLAAQKIRSTYESKSQN